MGMIVLRRLVFAIPLLFALIGFVRLYRDDWRLGLTMTAAFLSAGPLLYILYLLHGSPVRDTCIAPSAPLLITMLKRPKDSSFSG